MEFIEHSQKNTKFAKALPKVQQQMSPAVPAVKDGNNTFTIKVRSFISSAASFKQFKYLFMQSPSNILQNLKARNMLYPPRLSKDWPSENSIPVLQEIISPVGADFHFMVNLLAVSFPPDERRLSSDLENLIRRKENFHCCLIMADGKAIGLLNWWEFEKCNFLEHFALSPYAQNMGLGTAVLKNILLYRPLLLEVERPDSDLNRRRIAFYERNDLRLWDNVSYIQPPYSVGREPVPMSLMASPELPQSQAEEYISTIHRNVYGKAD